MKEKIFVGALLAAPLLVDGNNTEKGAASSAPTSAQYLRWILFGILSFPGIIGYVWLIYSGWLMLGVQ